MTFALFLLVGSCKKDSSQPLTKLDTQEIMKSSTFYLENLKATVDNRFSKMQPNWERAQITKDSNQLVYEVELTNPDQIFIGTSEVKLSDAKKFASKNLIRLLIFKEAATDKILQGCYMSIMSDDQNERINSFSYKKMGGFSGKIMYYHLDGSIANGWVYKSGNIIASISKSETQVPNIILNKSLSANRNEVPGKTLNKQILDQDCITESFPYFNYACAGVEGYEKCGWMVAGYDQVTTCYNPVGEGGSSGDEGGYTPPRRDCAGKVNGTAYIDPNCNTCIGGTTGLTECLPKEIIDNVKNPCLKTQTGVALTAKTTIRQMLNNTFGGTTRFEDLDLIIRDTTNLADNTDAEMQRLSGLEFEIRLNQNKLPNTSKEYILATIYHEILHAFMESKLLKDSNGKYIVDQHQAMATDYLILMAGALQTAFPGLSNNEAWALSWGGLEETQFYTTNLTEVQRTQITTLNNKHKNKSAAVKLGTYCN